MKLLFKEEQPMILILPLKALNFESEAIYTLWGKVLTPAGARPNLGADAVTASTPYVAQPASRRYPI